MEFHGTSPQEVRKGKGAFLLFPFPPSSIPTILTFLDLGGGGGGGASGGSRGGGADSPAFALSSMPTASSRSASSASISGT